LISSATIASVTGKLRLSEIAGDYFPVKRRGGRSVALCPFHKEKSPSFFINDSKNNYKCFGCGAGGSIIRFVMEMDHLSFPDAVRKLADRAGIQVEEEQSEEGKLRGAILSTLNKANQYFFKQLIGDGGSIARDHLRQRKFNSIVCSQWDIGLAPSDYNLSRTHHAIESGLAYEAGYPRFRDRIMFGIRDEQGQLVGFSGRTTTNHPAKYMNSPDSLVFTKGKLLYGLDRAKRKVIDSEEMVVVEGQIDAIRCHLAGITNVVAPLGTAFTDAHGAMVRRLCKRAVLIYDGDKAGQEAAKKAFAILAPLGIDVRSVVLPDGKDPDQFILDGGNLSELIAGSPHYLEALATCHKNSYEFVTDQLEAVKTIGWGLSKLDEGVVRTSMVNKLSAILGVGPAELRREIAACKKWVAIKAGCRQISESLSLLLARLLYFGKDGASKYNWQLINEPSINLVMESEYEAGDEASIMGVLSTMDSDIEAAVLSVDLEDARELSICDSYQAMVQSAIKRKSDDISQGIADPDEILPLMEARW
jgi:DNA primase